MKYKAFHYDMDGVLVNSEPLHVSAEMETCRRYGLDIDYDAWLGLKGRTAEDIFVHLYDEHVAKHGPADIPSVQHLIDHKTNEFINMIWDGRIEPIEGSHELVRWTRRHSEAQSLVTSSNHRIAQAILKYFNFQKSFDVQVTGDDVRIGKPHPGPYLKALRLTGAKASESLVFEDSKNGIRAALGARCAVMAITSSYHTREDLEKVNPTYIIDSFCEASALIKSL